MHVPRVIRLCQFVKNAETIMKIAWFWIPETVLERNRHGCRKIVKKPVGSVKVFMFLLIGLKKNKLQIKRNFS